MKLIANGVNNQYFESILPQKGIEVDGVLAAIAYGKDDTKFIQNICRAMSLYIKPVV